MTKPKVGKREHNKAVTKLKIMETFVSAMAAQPLDERRIEDLCQEIGISKVTFFNYFSSKEQIIEYFIYRWQYNLCYELERDTLKGIDAIKHIYHTVADHKAGHNIMITLMQFYLSKKTHERMVITPYEYYLFNRDAFDEQIVYVELTELFAKVLRTLEIPEAQVMPTVLNLVSGFYGVAFVMHIADTATGDTARQNLKIAYDRFVESVLIKD